MPPPRKALSPPCILALAGPAVKQVETSLQRRLPQSRVELQSLECLVADAEKNRVPRLPADIDLGVEQGVPDAVLVGDAIAIDAVAPVARLRSTSSMVPRRSVSPPVSTIAAASKSPSSTCPGMARSSRRARVMVTSPTR